MSVTRWYSLADAARALMMKTSDVVVLFRDGKLAGHGQGVGQQFLLDYNARRVPRYTLVPPPDPPAPIRG